MMDNQIYCFSLYCEGFGLTKAQAFVSIRKTEEEARYYADLKNKGDFPPEQGWHNHQMSMIAIPKERVLLLAKEYNQDTEANTQPVVSMLLAACAEACKELLYMGLEDSKPEKILRAAIAQAEGVE